MSSEPLNLSVKAYIDLYKSLQITPSTGKVNNMGKVVRRRQSNTRRSRTPNWSPLEKQYLLELIRERKDVVVTKANTGPHCSEEKELAWNQILRELSSRYGEKFASSNIKKVKTQWQNMKRIAREEISVHGTKVQSFTKQSIEVCQILDLVQDGVLRMENMPQSDTTLTTDVEIKAEPIDEDQQCFIVESDEAAAPSDQDNNEYQTPKCQPDKTQHQQDEAQDNSQEMEQCSSVSEKISDDEEEPEEPRPEPQKEKKNVSSMTEPGIHGTPTLNPIQRELQDFMRFSSVQKHMRLEALKEERQVMRAMRETAELNKIIAEQKLKHILWIKKQDMMMYSGEPGSGAGRGGGGGGAIREAGGTFGKMEAAREDEYFYKKQKEQLGNLKSHLDKEILFHQEQIKRHEDAIRRHKEQMNNMDQKKD